MELAHSLLLNEEALAQITEAKRPVFIFVRLVLLSRNAALLSALHEDTCLSSLTNYELEAMDHSRAFLSLSPNLFTNALY